MDNLPKDSTTQNDTTLEGGEIFTNTSPSGYDQATQLVSEEPPALPDVPLAPPTDYPTQPIQESSPQVQEPSSTEGVPPPPFVEDNRKKFMKIAVGVILFLLFIFGIFFYLKTRTKKAAVLSKITLNYWGLWEDEAVLRPVIDDYQRLHSNVTIMYKNQDSKLYRERLQAAIDRGEGPDIFRFHNTWLPMTIRQLAPVPKTIYSDSEFASKFYPVITEDLKTNGNYYGIPLSIDGLLLYYNEDILKSANVAVPTSWVDIQNAVAKLTVKENERIITSAVALGTAENIEHFSDILTLMMLQNGVQPMKSLFTCSDGSANTGTNCAVEALSFYHKFSETPTNSWDDTLENSILAFAGGKVAMIFAPSWQVFTIKQLAPELSFKTAPVPQLPCDRQPCPSVNLATYWVEGVSVKSKYQEAAFEFLKYLSQPDTVKKLFAEQSKVRKFGEPYALIELGNLLSDNPYLSAVITEAPTMKSFYSVTRTWDGETGINTGLTSYLKDAVNSLSQGVSSETALKTADDGFKQVYTRFGLAPTQ